jgi:hypothetical protein
MRTPHAVTLILAAGLAALAFGGAAQTPLPPPAAAVTPIPSRAADGAAQPNLAADSRGRVWMTWLEPKPGGGHRFQLSELSGSQWSTPSTITEGTTLMANWADFPSVFVASDGTMAAHYLERGTTRLAYHVRVKTSKDGGKSWSEPMTPHRDTSATEHGFVSFYDAPGGGVGLIWLDGREMAAGHGPGARGSMTLRSTVLKNGVAGDELVIDSKVCECCQTSAARTADAVLVAYRDRSDQEIRDTAVARLAGGKWSAPVTVGTDNWNITACPVNGPAIAASGQSAAVAWFTAAGDAPKTFVAFSTDGGRSFGGPIRLDTAPTLGRLDILMPSPDRAFVTSLERDAEGARVVLREVRRDGRVSAPVQIGRTTPDRPAGFPRIVSAGKRLVAAWTEPRPGGASRVLTAVMEAR